VSVKAFYPSASRFGAFSHSLGREAPDWPLDSGHSARKPERRPQRSLVDPSPAFAFRGSGHWRRAERTLAFGAQVDPINGACHCGGERFTARLTDGLRSARRCTCSCCRMRGAIAVSADPDGINITQGRELLTVYQFNTNTAQHYLLLALRHRHPSPAPFKSQAIWCQCRMP
jgi:hypothetical protein